MDSYIDVTIQSVEELSEAHTMSTVFSKLHRAISTSFHGEIGVSFPGMDKRQPTLGRTIRIHGRRDSLERLMALSWLGHLRDYVTCRPILSVPATALHRVVRRVQVKSNAARLRRRRMKRSGMSEAGALELLPDSLARSTNLPYLWVQSQSTDQRFKLFINHTPLRPEAIPGPFSAYGLGQEATVPWF